MADPKDAAFDLSGTYVHLEDGGRASAIDVSPEFWSELMSGKRRYDGRLITAHHMAEYTATWEMHPSGEELLILVSGAVDCILEDEDGERTVELRAGSACIVPRGVWHRQVVRQPGFMIFVTWGAGTQHRPV